MVGCSGGGNRNASRKGSTRQSSMFWKLARREGLTGELDTQTTITDWKKFTPILEFFGYGKVKKVYKMASKRPESVPPVFKGPILAFNSMEIVPGIHVRTWKEKACGEVLGIFDIGSKRYTVDVLMSASDEYKETRGLDNAEPKCQHPISDESEGFSLPTVNNSLYDVIVKDVAVIAGAEMRLTALTVAVSNIASIASNKKLSEGANEIWDSDSFADLKLPLVTVQYTNLRPRIVIVSYEDNETDGNDD